MKILAVDDDDTLRELLSIALKKMAFRDVRLCESAEAALDLIEEETAPFECFLLDIDMPGMDGIELCRKIRAMPKYEYAPIVMLSSLSDRVHIEGAFDAGASDYMTKPFDERELKARLYLAHKHGQEKMKFGRVRAEVEDVRSQLGKRKDFTLATPLELDDVAGALEYLALENFLLQMSGELGGVDVIAVKIGNVAEIFENTSASEFRFAINSVADAIAETLRLRQFFVSYAGDGRFAVVVRDGLGMEGEVFSNDLACNAEEIDVMTLGGKLLSPELFVGRAKRNGFIPRKANLRALELAMQDAEDRAARAADNWGTPEKRKIGPIEGWFEWLKAS